jgi:hypothetical protein
VLTIVSTSLRPTIYCGSPCSGVHCGHDLSAHLSDSVVPLFTPQHGRGVMTYASDRSSDVVERYDGEWFEGKMQVRRVLSTFVV